MRTEHMNESTGQMLSKIYKNVKMGAESITNILPKVKDEGLKSDLTLQLGGYENFASTVAKMLTDSGIEPKEESPIARVSARVGMAVNTLVDSTSSHIAEMVIEGSNMGITDMTKNIHEYRPKNCSSEAISIAEQVIGFEEKNLEKMKSYL